jgi:hypothetical protein
MQLKDIIADIKNYDGFTRKKGIGKITAFLKDVSDFGETIIGPGDDAAAVRDGDSYLLFASDGIWKKMLLSNPYAAGRSSVIVNVNDIYSMGGEPIAMVNVIASNKNYDIDSLLKGIRDACNIYRVPIVGGHYHPDSDTPELTVSIIGRAKKLLTSHTAKTEQDIIAVFDLEGVHAKGTWSSLDKRPPEKIRSNLKLMVRIAEQNICNTAKDISNPGILGTLVMLLHSSRKGAEVNLNKIPRPAGVYILDWLKIYPSYGFIMCVDKDKSVKCINIFKENGLSAEIIGKIIDKRKIFIALNNEQEIFFDFEKEEIY